MSVERIPGGSSFEAHVGYCRVVSFGGWVISAGTTATVDGSVAHVGDVVGQTRVAFGIALEAMAKAGVTASDVVRTRMYVLDISAMNAIGAVHKELFGAAPPVSTMVEVSALAHPDHLIEVEVEAYRPEANG